MGQQHRKVVKRRRLKAYVERKKALAKQGVARKVSRVSKSVDQGEKPAAKKAAVKKKVAKKAAAKVETPEVETAAAEKVVDTAVETSGESQETAAE